MSGEWVGYGGRQLGMANSKCKGHPAGPFDPMGQTVYCNGSCIPKKTARKFQKTIYRKCQCGETAHDFYACTKGPTVVRLYRCRNCNKERSFGRPI